VKFAPDSSFNPMFLSDEYNMLARRYSFKYRS